MAQGTEEVQPVGQLQQPVAQDQRVQGVLMDDDDGLQQLAQRNRELEYLRMREEGYCPHGIHPDSGRVCVECLVNARNE
jgi:hypothetical protein